MNRFSIVICMAISFATTISDDAADTVKVYILAGQSNMEGKAKNKLWDHQATDPATKDFFAHLRDGDKWVERDDGKMGPGMRSLDPTGENVSPTEREA